MVADREQAGTAGRQRAATVRDVTYELLRAQGLTTIFGNLGSTEETFWPTSPPASGTCWGCRRPSVIAMADGFAQATRRPALVNLHSGAAWGTRWGTCSRYSRTRRR
jgi:benzoylformate decarboxylase